MASAFRTAANLNKRQVHVFMYPSPRSLAQSRSVLKALQQFGEVTAFLNSKYVKLRTAYSGRTAYAIFASNEAADEAIRASPLRVSVPIQSSIGNLSSPDQQDPASLVEEAPDATTSKNSTVINCEIQTSTYDHKIMMSKNPYNMAFQVSRQWYEVQDLADGRVRVPQVEYADCFTKRKLGMPSHLQKGMLQKSINLGATSLMKMWKKGIEEKEAMEKRREEEMGNRRGERDGEMERQRTKRDNNIEKRREEREESEEEMESRREENATYLAELRKRRGEEMAGRAAMDAEKKEARKEKHKDKAAYNMAVRRRKMQEESWRLYAASQERKEAERLERKEEKLKRREARRKLQELEEARIEEKVKEIEERKRLKEEAKKNRKAEEKKQRKEEFQKQKAERKDSVETKEKQNGQNEGS